MAVARSWIRPRCPWCSGQLDMRNVPFTLIRGRFRCPHCRNKLRLHLLPLLLISVLIWAPVGIPVLLIAWRDGGASMWFLVLSTVGDAILFFALLAPLFVRARQSAQDALSLLDRLIARRSAVRTCAFREPRWLLRVGHGRPAPNDERRFDDLHRPFTPRWPV